jgi:hypothetical protein
LYRPLRAVKKFSGLQAKIFEQSFTGIFRADGQNAPATVKSKSGITRFAWPAALIPFFS